MCLQVNASTIDGVTPLLNACTVGSVSCTELLLESGAKPQSVVYHPSPIHEATSKGIHCTKCYADMRKCIYHSANVQVHRTENISLNIKRVNSVNLMGIDYT